MRFITIALILTRHANGTFAVRDLLEKSNVGMDGQMCRMLYHTRERGSNTHRIYTLYFTITRWADHMSPGVNFVSEQHATSRIKTAIKRVEQVTMASLNFTSGSCVIH